MVVAALAVAEPGAAESVAEFYAGKQIRLVIGTEPGITYDLYARLITRYLPTHLPGNPTFLPQNMPGASGRVAANWLYNVAPRDGSVIGTFGQTAPVDQARKLPGVQFEVKQFNWIGNPIVDNTLTNASAES